MKPSTIERRAQRAIAETTRRRAEAVVRLAETVARHEMAGDLIQAAVFTELLLEAQERVREDITHVRVGDHTPEPRNGKAKPIWGNIPLAEPDDGTGRWRDL